MKLVLKTPVGGSAIGLALLLLAFTLKTPGQEITATITGIVSDATGGVIPGAVIHIVDADKEIIRRTLRTSSLGQYNASLLQIGHYSVTAEAPGFKKAERAGINLNLNDQWVVNFVLQVGAVDQQVAVEADRLQVDLQTPAASGVANGNQIRELPLNTRNYALLVALQPGVSAKLASDQLYVGVSGPNGSVNQLNFSVNGPRPEENNWTLDGADNLDRGRNNTLLACPSVESLEEFRLLRGNYSPEFPSGASGQVIAMTPSGTSQFRGSVYEFFRNDVLASNNYFNNRNNLPRPPLRYNNFGFTIGGPLSSSGKANEDKNKTFFFYSEEWRRVIDYGTLISRTMPTVAQQQGAFTEPVCTQPVFDPVTGACAGPTTTQITSIDPTAAAYIKDIYSKLPAPGGDGNIAATAKNQYDFRGETIRVDPSDLRRVSWGEGTRGTLHSCFAALRVRVAHRDYERSQPHQEQWLLLEWPKTEKEPTKYWLSNLPESVSVRKLVATAKLRWRIERDYEELKQELGLGHFEGRNWRGFHHHATLCIAAYGFLVRERCLFSPAHNARAGKIHLRLPAVPRGLKPRGSARQNGT